MPAAIVSYFEKLCIGNYGFELAIATGCPE
jgi:hypothetical protein